MNRLCFALSKLIHINYFFSLCCDLEVFMQVHVLQWKISVSHSHFLFILYIPFFLLYLAFWSISIIYEALFFHAC